MIETGQKGQAIIACKAALLRIKDTPEAKMLEDRLLILSPPPPPPAQPHKKVPLKEVPIKK